MDYENKVESLITLMMGRLSVIRKVEENKGYTSEWRWYYQGQKEVCEEILKILKEK